MTREFVDTWKSAHPSDTVIHRDLAVSSASPLDAAWIQAAHTDATARTPEQSAILALSEELIGELERSDK